MAVEQVTARFAMDAAASAMEAALEPDLDPATKAGLVAEAQVWATLAHADATLRVATAIGHVTHRGAILTQQRGGN